MRIGIITNTDTFIPFAYALATAGPQLQVHLFFSPSPDGYVNQKVTAFAQQLNISFVEEKNAAHDLYKWLAAGNFDVCFMLGYSALIDLNRIKTPVKLYNIHFGILPSFRGPVPVFWQLKQGVEKVGVTIHEVNQKFDAGPVIWIKETENLPHYNYETVNQLLGQLCVDGVIYILRFIMNSLPLPVINRDQIRPHYHKRPELKDVMIDWQNMKAVEICDLVRAGNPWNKGALTFWGGQELKLMDAAVLTSPANLNTELLSPGKITEDEEKLHVYCADGNLISVNMLFYGNSFIPAYHVKLRGLLKGAQIG